MLPRLGSQRPSKINSRTSFGAGLLPTCLQTLEVSRQLHSKTSPVPADYGFGRDDEQGCFQSEQTRWAITQESLSRRRLHRPRKWRTHNAKQRPTKLNVVGIYNAE